MKDSTFPYGFVPPNAKVWFQKFQDDGVVHEYLMTEGYLWTGQYPEVQRVIDHGNNQSMELDPKTLDAFWTKDDKGKPQFFIINEAIMSKLCILGEDFEPCFEGAQITKVQFSFEDSFKEQLFSMMNQVQEILNEGGAPVFNTYAVTIGDSLWNAIYENIDSSQYSINGVFEEDGQKFAVLLNREDNTYSRMNFSYENEVYSQEELVALEDYTPAEEPQFALADVEAFEVEFKKKKEEGVAGGEEDPEDNGDKDDDKEPEDDEGDKEPESDPEEDADEKKKKKNYNLEEVEEYTELKTQFDELQNKYSALEASTAELNKTIEELTKFKAGIERTQKEDMINNTFYMLSNEDKKDVIDNIDKYSLDEIEAKLAIICVRNKVSFDLDDDNNDNGTNGPVVYNLGDDTIDSSTPAWVKALDSVAKSMR